MALLETRNLTKHFGGLAALNSVEIDVNEKEILGIIGPNGAGKTTMFNLVSGFLLPTTGKIIFSGEDITKLKLNQVARRGIVRSFQTNVLLNERTVLANVIFGHFLQLRTSVLSSFLNFRSARKEEFLIHQKAIDIMKMTGIDHLKNELAKNLSHGYQRLLGVSIALSAQPKLLLLDEPMSGLNLQECENMMSFLRSLRNRDITLVVVEHNMKAIMRLCERIVVLDAGRKIAEGSPEEIQENPEVIKAYLGFKK